METGIITGGSPAGRLRRVTVVAAVMLPVFPASLIAQVGPVPALPPVAQGGNATGQATASAPAPFQPNVSDGTQFVAPPPALVPPAGVDAAAFNPFRNVKIATPSGLSGAPDLVAPNSSPSSGPEAPALQMSPVTNGPVTDLSSHLTNPLYLGQSNENRPLAPLVPPSSLRANHGIPIGGGRVRYGASVSASVSTISNVFGTPNNPQRDFVFTLQPVVYAEAGQKNTVQFLWAPSVLKYARFKQFDTVDQNFRFSARYRVTKLTLGLDASYVTQSGLFLNSQGQAKQSTVLARIFASYPLGRKTNLSMSAEGSVVDSSPGGRQFNGKLSSSVDYRYSPKTSVGFGVDLGTNNASSSTTTYQAFLIRLAYNPTAKILFRGDGGIQFRQSTSTGFGSSSTSTAVLSALLAYRFSEKTTVSMRFYRNVDVNPFNASSIQTVTGVEATLVWRMTQRALLEAALGAGNVQQTNSGGQNSGSYAFAQGSVALSYALLQDVNVRVFNSFQQRYRDAQQSGNYFSSTTGMSLGATF